MLVCPHCFSLLSQQYVEVLHVWYNEAVWCLLLGLLHLNIYVFGQNKHSVMQNEILLITECVLSTLIWPFVIHSSIPFNFFPPCRSLLSLHLTLIASHVTFNLFNTSCSTSPFLFVPPNANNLTWRLMLANLCVRIKEWGLPQKNQRESGQRRQQKPGSDRNRQRQRKTICSVFCAWIEMIDMGGGRLVCVLPICTNSWWQWNINNTNMK